MSRCSILLLVLLAVLSGCHTGDVTDLDRVTRSSQAKSIAVDPRFTVYSPYGGETTDRWAELIREETDGVATLFAIDIVEPFTVWLVPLDGDDAVSAFRPSNHGELGRASAAAFRLYVPKREVFGAATEDFRGTVRHELTHLCHARSGLSAPRWAREGIANEVETMLPDSGATGLELDPIPIPLAVARLKHREVPLDDLLTWDPAFARDGPVAYALAQSLVRFLAGHPASPDIRARAASLAQLRTEDVLAREREWRDWLDSLDALTSVRELAARDASHRRIAAAKLCELAEFGDESVLSSAGDRFAIELLSERDTRVSAATFLLFFRARAINEGSLPALASAPDPGVRLVCFALRQRRGERGDADTIAATWREFEASDASQASVMRATLGDIAGEPLSR